MLERLRFPVLMILAAGLWPGWALAQDRIPEFRARFTQETDPLRRAQMMPRLGEAEFDEITRDVDGGKLPEALVVLKEYRDEIESCEKGLDKRNINAERHPKGYKQLEISLRESLRRLNGLLISFTGDDQKPFLEVRADLDELNRHLIRELFPNQADKETAPPN
ncbi:MAG: hypothetical protein ABSA57_02865 [Candidatus Acidiferrales bacterium]